MDINTARILVQAYLRGSEDELNSFGSGLPGYESPYIELVILGDRIQEHDFGWVFFYNSKKYIQTGDFRDALAGNAPLIVDRESGEIHRTGTSHEIDYYISNYRVSGDPNKSASCRNI